MMVDIPFKGEIYQVPMREFWKPDIYVEIEQQRLMSAVKGILGDDQFARLETIQDVADLLRIIMESV